MIIVLHVEIQQIIFFFIVRLLEIYAETWKAIPLYLVCRIWRERIAHF
jgi:hypothetical protein